MVKVRSGFVSNSSSSSFVLVGFEIPRNVETDDLLEKHKLSYLSEQDVVGMYINYWDSYDFTISSLQEVESVIATVKAVAKEVGVEEVRLYSGTVYN
jgi:hypothetical protein